MSTTARLQMDMGSLQELSAMDRREVTLPRLNDLYRLETIQLKSAAEAAAAQEPPNEALLGAIGMVAFDRHMDSSARTHRQDTVLLIETIGIAFPAS
ncbi:MAG: hypothetical protein ACHQT9_03910 [Candidatus Saccharimonadales bacterium]